MLIKSLSKVSPMLQELKLGKTLVLYKSKHQEELIRLQREVLSKRCIRIQALYRGRLAGKRVAQLYKFHLMLNEAMRRKKLEDVSRALVLVTAGGLDNYLVREGSTLEKKLKREQEVRSTYYIHIYINNYLYNIYILYIYNIG